MVKGPNDVENPGTEGELRTHRQLFAQHVREGLAAGASLADAKRTARHLMSAYDVFVVDPRTGRVWIRVGGPSLFGNDDDERGR